jgi:hypothetical protein
MAYLDLYSEELTRKLKKIKNKIDIAKEIVKFEDFEHHDKIYKRKY